MLSNLLHSTVNNYFESFMTMMTNSPSYIESFLPFTFSPDSFTPSFLKPLAFAPGPANHGNNTSELEQQLLAQLVDIKNPESIGIWPFAPGVWAIIIAIIIGVTLYMFLHAQRKKNKYRQSALSALEQLQHDYAKNKKNENINAQQQYTQSIITLLKQVVFTAYPSQRSHIAGLPSNTFVHFLQYNSPKPTSFNSEQLYIPNDILYGNTEDSTYSPHILARFATMWIKSHKASELFAPPQDKELVTHSTHSTQNANPHTNTHNVSPTEEAHAPS